MESYIVNFLIKIQDFHSFAKIAFRRQTSRRKAHPSVSLNLGTPRAAAPPCKGHLVVHTPPRQQDN